MTVPEDTLPLLDENSSEKSNPRKPKKFEKNFLESGQVNALRSMASNMSSALSNALTLSSKSKEKRIISKETCTTYDVYVQCKHMEKLIRGIEKSLELGQKSFRVEINDYPFDLPLTSEAAVENCETFLQSKDNYQVLVTTSLITLFSSGVSTGGV